MPEEDSLIEIFEAPFAKGITGTIFEIAKKVGGSTFQVIGDRRKATRALKNYADKYKSSYGLLQLLGIRISDLSKRQFYGNNFYIETTKRANTKR